ncbi:flagella synthesis protein FlgN [Nitrosospira sp. Nl5]|uniref:flagella synthesis protein FlgN n=1 Tax=Nitrosospira sp. Nl5 TaxID=200120 RepID=UPI00088B653C|nr:flagellar protein FlgN [Nitrosospira sp. Nl5]SCY06508.1 flagella synthesis protein FlgN [Nitrosospira sp. Nl5]
MADSDVKAPLAEMAFDPAACITRERDAARDFVDVLKREQHALQQADVSLLPLLEKEKAQQAQQLAQLADARNYWLAKLGHTQDRLGIERGLETCPAAADAWRELLQLAETASQLNKINGILVNQRLRYNQQALSVLQAATHGTGLYGADGQPRLFSAGRQLGEG